MSKSQPKLRVLHWIGGLLAVAGMLYVGLQLFNHPLDIEQSRFTHIMLASIFLLSLVYGAANFLLAKAWWYLLGNRAPSLLLSNAIRIYGISQIARYLPGNILHFAGRQALGMAAGISSRSLVKSTVFELSLLAVAAAQFVWLVLPLFTPLVSPLGSILVVFSSFISTCFITRRLFGNYVLNAFIRQFIFMVLAGLIFCAVLLLSSNLTERTWENLLLIVGAYITAWLIGFVAIGAPAGIGVRESILLFFLSSMASESDVLVAVLLGRLVTVVGDILFFFIALFITMKREAMQVSDVSK